MKKILSLLLFAAIAFSLGGCGGHAGAPVGAGTTPTPTATPDMSDILTASATNASEGKTPPASGTDTQQTQSEPTAQTSQEAYEKALACVGLPVEELYAAVGQPTGTPTYGPSCLQVDAEDGMLPYDGFSVWTVRSSTAETVHEVYLSE